MEQSSFHGDLTQSYPVCASNCLSSLASFSFCACDSCRSHLEWAKTSTIRLLLFICSQLSFFQPKQWCQSSDVFPVRELRGEQLLILSNSLQKVDSSHQFPWTTWMTLIKKHQETSDTLRNVKKRCAYWTKLTLTQGSLSNCPSKLSKCVQRGERSDWWQGHIRIRRTNSTGCKPSDDMRNQTV